MVPKGFVCKQCGNCCLKFLDAAQGEAAPSDVELWQRSGRNDILAWVYPMTFSDGRVVSDIWISPTTHDDVDRCPWLRKLPGQNKYICRINDVKPGFCKKYPITKKHALEIGCEGFDP